MTGVETIEQQSDSLAGLADIPRLTAWLDADVSALGAGPLTAKKTHGGTSNVVLSLDRCEGPMILRRPPVRWRRAPPASCRPQPGGSSTSSCSAVSKRPSLCRRAG